MEKLPRFRLALLLVGVLATVLGAKFLLVQQYGSELPFWDQWDAEGEYLYLKDVRGQLEARDLLGPHNEHRILFTRLLAWGLLKVNSHWDARIQAVANAAIHLAALMTLLWPLLRRLPAKAGAGLSVAVAILFSLPFTWENTISGFQSQFYFLLLFSVGHFAGTLFYPAGSRRWWLAQACGLAAMFSMGSGFFSSCALIAITVIQALRSRRWERQELFTLASCTCLLAVGLLLHSPYPPHDSLRASNASEFFAAWGKTLGWPAPHALLGPLMMLFPWLWALRDLVDRNRPWNPLLGFAATLGGWWVLQTAAVAFARGNGGTLSPRYLDTFATGVVAGLLVFLVLLVSSTSTPRIRHWLWVSAGAWIVAIAACLLHQNNEARHTWLRHLPEVNEIRTTRVRAFVNADPSRRELEGQPYWQLPYADTNRLEYLLNIDELAELLPFSVRRGLPLHKRGSPVGFSKITVQSPGTGLGLNVWSSEKRPAGSEAVIELESREAPRTRFLRFFVTGRADAAKVSMSLESEGKLTPISIGVTPDRWSPVVVDAPKGPFRLVLRAAPDTWVAVSEPVEMAFGSWAIRHVVKSHTWLLALGTLCLLIGGTLACNSGGGDRSGPRPLRHVLAIVIVIAVICAGTVGAIYVNSAVDTPPVATALAAFVLAVLTFGPGLLVVPELISSRAGFSDYSALLLSLATLCAASYLIFWILFASAGAGLLCIWALWITTFGLLLWRARGVVTYWRRNELRWPLLFALWIGLSYIGILYAAGDHSDVDILSAHRFSLYLPPDNQIPRLFAERLVDGQSPRHLIGDWLSSDRPPLQAGFAAVVLALNKAVALPRTSAAHAAGVFLQLYWVPVIWILGRAFGLNCRRCVLLLFACATTGFFLLNSVYVWPKLGTGALAIAAFYVWMKEPTCRLRGTLVGALGAFAFLGHGGAAYSLLALGLVALFRPKEAFSRSSLAAAAVFVLLLLPWQLYQKYYEPPGNRLIKWHLAGVIPIDERSAGQTLLEEYGKLTWTEIMEKKWANARESVVGDYLQILQVDLGSAQYRRSTQFFMLIPALGVWIVGLPLLLWRVVANHTTPDAALPFLRALFAWVCLTYVCWVVLMFSPPGAVTMIVHQSSYAMMAGALVLLVAAVLHIRALWPAWILLTAGTVSFATTWLPPEGGIVRSGVILGLLGLVAFLETARRLHRANESSDFTHRAAS